MADNTRKVKTPNAGIHVTELDIATAVPKDSGHCMIADAVRRAVPTAENIAVDLQTIRWSDRKRGLRYIYLTPVVAQMALLDFDNGDRGALEPFSFKVKKGHVTQMNLTAKKAGDGSAAGGEARLVPDSHDKVRSLPNRVGGRPPGRGALSNDVPRRTGLRREFGLRAMGRRGSNG